MKYFPKIKGIEVFYLAFKKYRLDQSVLHSSALTYYCLLSLVPLLAVIMAISKGFGLKQFVNAQLHELLSHQEEVLDYALNFADALLNESKSGIFVGSGIAILLWSVINVFLHIEKIFNTIWHARSEHSLSFRIGQGVILSFLAPIFLICLSGLLINVQNFIGDSLLQRTFLPILPMLILTLIFSLIYYLLPATRVSYHSALIGGLFAAAGYMCVQWLLVNVQILTAKHNVIYGSFASLPIFLFWLKATWTLIIYFAQFVFIFNYKITKTWQFDFQKISIHKQQAIAFQIFHACLKASLERNQGLKVNELSKITKLPIPTLMFIVNKMIDNKLIIKYKLNKKYYFTVSPYYIHLQELEFNELYLQ